MGTGRNATTVGAQATYRRGATAPQSSSLGFFVAVALAVGVVAFGVMSVCMPEPFEKRFTAPVFPPPPPIPPILPASTEAPPTTAPTAPPAVAVEAEVTPSPVAKPTKATKPRAGRRAKKRTVD